MRPFSIPLPLGQPHSVFEACHSREGSSMWSVTSVQVGVKERAAHLELGQHVFVLIAGDVLLAHLLHQLLHIVDPVRHPVNPVTTKPKGFSKQELL